MNNRHVYQRISLGRIILTVTLLLTSDERLIVQYQNPLEMSEDISEDNCKSRVIAECQHRVHINL